MYAAAAIPPQTLSPAKTAAPATGQQQPKLLDRLRKALRSHHHNPRTEQSHCQRVKRFIFFHNVRHPTEMTKPKFHASLTHLAIEGNARSSSCATHLLEDAYDIRAIQALHGHKEVQTTMTCTHILNRGREGVRSPADTL